jgi:N,N'-diacetyllegionaminate synthase
MKKNINIIAEIGVNHDGKLNKAIKLIELAKKCGADTVKFQNFTATNLVKSNAKKTQYQLNTTPKSQSHYEMLQKLELKEIDFLKIVNFCRKIKIEFLSTPYDVESVDLLEKLNVKRYKVASTDLVDLILHKKLISTKKPILISTGASNLQEIEKTMNFYKFHNHKKITLMHCVSNYPCSEKSINLNILSTLKKNFGFPIGYSDHSDNNIASIMSVSFGVEVIEKHFTLNKNSSGPDHAASADPKEFKKYVESIRSAEIILGSNIKKVQKEELSIRKISRKSITLAKDIFKNSKINEDDLIMKRPGGGILGLDIYKVIGKRVNKKLLKDYQIKHKDLIK